jgi:hypothetical protein
VNFSQAFSCANFYFVNVIDSNNREAFSKLFLSIFFIEISSNYVHYKNTLNG